MQIRDHVFIVTGGASGLGRGTAEMLVEHGARVVLADIGAEAVARQAELLGPAARAVVCDVTSEHDGQAAVRAATGFGTLRGLVNCAGIAFGLKTVGRDGPHPLDRFVRVVQVNLIGTFNMIRLAAQAIADTEPLPSGERGVIVNTASVAAYDGQSGQAAYAAAKAGIAGMTLPVARDLARDGIRVMAIAPGIFETRMMLNLPQDARDSMGRQVPFPARLGRPAEYAQLVRQIIENEMLNGEVIRLDGAIRMAAR